MWQYVGVVRDGKGLRQVVAALSALAGHRQAVIAVPMKLPTSCKPDC